MKRLIGLLCVFLTITIGAAAIAVADDSNNPEIERARAALSQLQGEGFAGTVLAACGDQILLHEHYGLALAADQTPSYWLASITKQFTAAAVLRLVAESDLTLQTPLKVLFERVPEDKAEITVHQLLSHQSGLPQAFVSSGHADRDLALKAILDLQLDRPPGSGFGYSNDGYTLLAIILEVVSGVRYEIFLEQSVIRPAGLLNAAFWPHLAREGEVIPPLASSLASEAYVEDWDFRGAVGIRMSAADLHRWVLALDRLQVLDQRQLEQLLGPYGRTSSGIRVGDNWFWEKSDVGHWMLWTRGQEQFGANSVLYLFPGTDLILIATTHAGPAESGSGPVTGWSRKARDLLIDVLDQKACSGRQPLFGDVGVPESNPSGDSKESSRTIDRQGLKFPSDLGSGDFGPRHRTNRRFIAAQ